MAVAFIINERITFEQNSDTIVDIKYNRKFIIIIVIIACIVNERIIFKQNGDINVNRPVYKKL